MSKLTKEQLDALRRPYELFTAECLRVHELCDSVHVPREVNGTVLSISQRVEVMRDVLRGMHLKLCTNMGGTLQ